MDWKPTKLGSSFTYRDLIPFGCLVGIPYSYIKNDFHTLVSSQSALPLDHGFNDNPTRTNCTTTEQNYQNLVL